MLSDNKLRGYLLDLNLTLITILMYNTNKNGNSKNPTLVKKI